MTLDEANALNDRLAVRLTAAPLFVLCVLVERLGRTQNEAAISDAVMQMAAKRPTSYAIRSAIRHIRASGVAVINQRDLGYRLDELPPMRGDLTY